MVAQLSSAEISVGCVLPDELDEKLVDNELTWLSAVMRRRGVGSERAWLWPGFFTVSAHARA
jgi:hypothetical protein